MVENTKRNFLSAAWRHLLLINFKIDGDLLLPYLPPNCELDTYDGYPYVSIVAFEFLDTRVFGLKWPGFTNFPEINLRFYIRHGNRRGVCFISEFVPSFLVSTIAKLIYNEPYRAAKIDYKVREAGQSVSAAYRLNYRGQKLSVSVHGANRPEVPGEDSLEHFFKEHDLGVGCDRRGHLVTYGVRHPLWEVYPVNDCEIDLNAVGLYGDAFAFLEKKAPDSVVFARGSEIEVFPKNDDS